MANTIANSFVEQFKSNVVHLAQQKSSRLKDYVTSAMCNGETHNFERIGSADAVEKTTRHTDTPVLDVPHSRRKVTLRDWHWADLIDEEDKLRQLINPNSEYVKTGAYAMGRQYDSLILAAARGNATDGAGASVALPAGQKVAHGSASLTIAKLLSAREILWANDVDEDNDPLCIVVSGTELSALLNTTEVKSSDYNSVKALVKGEIDTFLGYKFIRSNLVETTAGVPNQRWVTAFYKSGMGLAMGADVHTYITQRDDKSYAHQVYLAFTAEATRIEDEKVVEISCTYT